MYAEQLRAYVSALGRMANVPDADVTLLEESLACYLSLFAAAVGGTPTPQGDLLTTSVRLSLLTESLTRRDPEPSLDGIHYLVAMGYEQSGAVFASLVRSPDHPIENDAWYRLVLATLHYLAGGYRVQAMSSRRAASRVDGSASQYRIAARMLEYAFEGGIHPTLSQDVEKLTEGYPTARRIISGLIAAIRRRADVLLTSLGERDLDGWARQHNLDAESAEFWGTYLSRLRERGITSFTKEQGTFDQWLRRDTDLLVQLPTGGGKSIVGELLTALHLAAGSSVVWLLPTRALVRHFKRELATAFARLDVEVEELPTTEDALPLFAEDIPIARQVAVTTPERLTALIRANPTALHEVGLIVFDEAHLLLDKTRGVTAEHLLRAVRNDQNQCRLALMTGFAEAKEPLERTMTGLGAPPRVLVSEVRPTRRIYGAVTDEKSSDGRARVTVLVHPPRANADHPDLPPFAVYFRDSVRTPSSSPTDIAARLAKAVHSADAFRSVFFVTRRSSADTQARKLAEYADSKKVKPLGLSRGAIARLRLELGRKSALESTAPQRVASHHGGLAPLEQQLVERWLTAGKIRTLFATPTLAQGVNLPLNLSVVTYTERFNQLTRERERIPAAEIMNMLGRAGRAGKVADGLCLLALESATPNRPAVMRRAGSVFFARPIARTDVGVAALLSTALPFFGTADWPQELAGVPFSDAQTLVGLALNMEAMGVENADGVRALLEAYPSVIVLDPQVRAAFASRLVLLIANLRGLLGHEPLATQVAMRTGLPPEYCLSVVASVRAAPIEWNEFDVTLAWCDEVVRTALEKTATRDWQRYILGGYSLETVIRAVDAWRSASTVAALERILAREDPVEERARIGDYLNHHMTVLAQFWAALAVAAEVMGRDEMAEGIRPVPALVRDGVPTTGALVWLRGLGGLDRVLAKELSAAIELPIGGLSQQQREVRRQVRAWQSRAEPVPSQFAVPLENLLSDEE